MDKIFKYLIMTINIYLFNKLYKQLYNKNLVEKK